MKLRIATYNIHRCIGQDRKYDPLRIRDVIQAIGPDIIALQEVEQLHTHPELLPILCEDSDLSAIPGLTMSHELGHYGNALLTNLPVTHIERLDISHPGREPRGAIAVVMDAGHYQLLVIASHFGLRRTERHCQAIQLLDYIKHRERADQLPRKKPLLIVMLGDFNLWWPYSKTNRLFKDHFSYRSSAASFPGALPLLALDRIWINSPVCITPDFLVHRDRISRLASDHLPVVTELTLPGNAGL